MKSRKWAAFIPDEVLTNERARRAFVTMVRDEAAAAGYRGRVRFVEFKASPGVKREMFHRGRFVFAAGRIYGASRRARIDLLVTETLVEEDRLHGLRWGGTTYTGCLIEGQTTIRLEVHPRLVDGLFE